MKPLIGISVDCKFEPHDERSNGKLSLNWNYAQSVADAGGVPLLIPPQADTAEIASILDGWLIPGGADIDAANWGEKNHSAVKTIAPERFNSEKRMFESIDPAMPVLGICYGCQFLNVAKGGSLEQHLPDVVGHDRHSGGTMQAYEIDPRSKLGQVVCTTRVDGRSYHHQAVKRLGSGLLVVAKGDDGIIEAIEATDRPWMIGVQWHPERTSADAATKRLFEEFVSASHQYRKARAQ